MISIFLILHKMFTSHQHTCSTVVQSVHMYSVVYTMMMVVTQVHLLTPRSQDHSADTTAQDSVGGGDLSVGVRWQHS